MPVFFWSITDCLALGRFLLQFIGYFYHVLSLQVLGREKIPYLRFSFASLVLWNIYIIWALFKGEKMQCEIVKQEKTLICSKIKVFFFNTSGNAQHLWKCPSVLSARVRALAWYLADTLHFGNKAVPVHSASCHSLVPWVVLPYPEWSECLTLWEHFHSPLPPKQILLEFWFLKQSLKMFMIALKFKRNRNQILAKNNHHFFPAVWDLHHGLRWSVSVQMPVSASDKPQSRGGFVAFGHSRIGSPGWIPTADSFSLRTGLAAVRGLWLYSSAGWTGAEEGWSMKFILQHKNCSPIVRDWR